ncbi:MAG TPA: DUF262 domain-containing protein [Thermoplasmata archaeon]|nr:DUF262 domain-containing protein [Thermoplasmata archaeon]
MRFSTIGVRELVEQAVRGDLDIPEFQREFVWRPEQVLSLADSLCRDYPIGQLLTWEHADEAEARGAQGARAPKLWLVDGQQRSTALCLLFGAKPFWWSRSDDWNRWLASANVLAKLSGAPGEIELGLSNPIRAADSRWVEVRTVLGLGTPGASEPPPGALEALADAILHRWPSEQGKEGAVESVRQRLRIVWELQTRTIPLATVDREIEEVAEIFRRLNQQGTEIVESDIALATAASLRASWVREGFLPFLKNLADSGFDLPPGVAVRALTAVGTGRIRLREIPREFWTDPEFDASWEATRRALSYLVGGFVGAGILNSTLLPSRNTLVPLVALRAKFSDDRFLFPRALHWALLALRDGRYSGSSASTLSEDVRTIRGSSSFSEALESLRGSLESGVRVEPPEFLDRWTWSRPLVLILYLAMYDRKARDLLTGQRLGHASSGPSPEVGFVPYLHPFFPKGRTVLHRPEFDYTEDEANAIANLVFLNERPKDRRWLHDPPSTYFEGPAIPGRQLEEQAIPLDRALWEPDRYRDFLEERSRLLAKTCNDYLAALAGAPRGPEPE